MARDRQSRREREASEDRTQRLIYYGAGAVLVVALILVVVGLFITRYLPPRAHVLTVEDRSYNASDIVDRGNYLMTVEGAGNDVLGDVAARTVEVLITEETLRRSGPSLVGPISEAQIDAQIQVLFGFDPDEDPLTPIPGDDDDGDADDGDGSDDPEATPEPTPDLFPLPPDAPRELNEGEQEQFSADLANVLSITGISREGFERIAEALVVRQLLNRHFEGDVGLGGEQLRLSRLIVDNPAAANEFRERALAGEDFTELFLEAQGDTAGAIGPDDIPGDLGWFPRELIPDEIAEVIEGLGAGGVSEVLDRGISFELFFISEIEADRPWEDTARQLLVRDRVDVWEAAARLELEIEIGLSDDEEIWIIGRVVSHVTEQLASGSGGF